MNDRVLRALGEREKKRRMTGYKAQSLLVLLESWADTGEPFILDLSDVAANTEVPDGSLAHTLEEPAKCHALAQVSSDPGKLLSLLVAYQQAQQ